MVNNFQRQGSASNAYVGMRFEDAVQEHFLQREGISLQKRYSLKVGLSTKKYRKFNLGSADPPLLVVCKSLTWTMTGKVPAAKLNTLNLAMYYFLLAPSGYRKVLFMLRDLTEGKEESLAEYYVGHNRSLIPNDVEIWEYDEGSSSAARVTVS